MSVGYLAPAPVSAWRRHRWALVAPLLASALAALGLRLGWRGVDLSAQLYRVTMVRHHGVTLWDSQWYGGHWAFSYSVIFPMAAALIGVGGLALLSAAAAALAFDRLAVGHFGAPGRLASVVFAASTIVELAIGQLPFLFGEALALACLVAATRRSWLPAVILGAATSLSSPLAGAFLAVAVVAWLTAAGAPRRGLSAVLVALTLPMAAVMVLFGSPGAMPYPTVDLAWELVIAGGLWVLTPRSERTLRTGMAIYVLSMVASYAIPSAVGGNVGRLEDLLALPLAVAVLWRRRRLLLAAAAVPLVLSQWGPAWGAMTSDAAQPSTHRSYYAPLLDWLDRSAAASGRVEVVPTKYHWEATYVAPTVALARGWERQLDLGNDRIFYTAGALDRSTYVSWLRDNGVKYVALADAPLDYAAVAEGELVRAGVPGLRLVWRDAHWRVFEVSASSGIVDGPATLISADGGQVVMDATGPGTVLVRVRYSPDWRLSTGVGCVGRAPGNWTSVVVPQAEPLRLDLRLFGGDQTACSTGLGG